MNRKKNWIIFGGVTLTLCIITVLFFWFKSDQSNETATIESEENIEEVIEQVQEKDEEMTQEENNFSSSLKNAVESTISLFVRNNYKIVAIGDSLTQGVGDLSNNGGYVGVIEDNLSDNEHAVTIENYGKRGNRSDQLLKRLEEDKIQASIKKADMILLTIGANDIMKVVKTNFMNLQEEPFEQERKAYKQRLQKIFDKMLALSPEADIYLIGFFNPFEGYFEDIEELDNILNNWNQTGRQLTLNHPQLHYIPTNDLFQLRDVDLLADDNFHPNTTGYTLIGERVLTYIRPTIETAQEETEHQNAITQE
ncbi:Spore germination lipase LipC [Paraliobacillus sp. PM-2]|uniref:SGNH/GDSL hydrolase family protein n=1 Tax=Paraliobacillus sp. PM-2 TaxID=1462524 RepID=UPI00061BF75B|nr:SGNH/GDSL hydrolase family protein [Paraliobacillus sp. PM-2]CQR46097.1 Spore germination lipase LipC [Paraliobacillus sp. PM-2]